MQIAPQVAKIKAKLDEVVRHYIDNCDWSYSFEANTGAANTDAPFPSMAGYMLPYCYYYHPADFAAIITELASISRSSINTSMHIEAIGFILNTFALAVDYAPAGAERDACLATGTVMAQEFVDNSMVHHDYLPYQYYTISSKASTGSTMGPFNWHALMPGLVYFLKNDSARLTKIKTVELHLSGLGTVMPSWVNADTGAAADTDPGDAHDVAALESCLNCYGLTGDADWLALANTYADRGFDHYWLASANMFVHTSAAGTPYPSGANGYVTYEAHTWSKNLAIMYQLGQINAAEMKKAEDNLIYRKHQFHRGVMETIGFGANRFNSSYSSAFQFRPEFAESCAMMYSVTGDEMWLQYAFQNIEAMIDIAWSIYGPARNIDLNDLSKDDYTVPEWLFELASVPIAYEKLTGTSYANHVCTTFATPFLTEYPPGDKFVIFEGDSMTAQNSYGGYAQLAIDDLEDYSYRETGCGGETMATMNTQAATQVDPYYLASRSKNVAVLWAGTNDLALNESLSAADLFALSETWVTGRQAVGFKTVIGTLLPKSYAGTPANYESRRLAYNALLRSSSSADAIADMAANTTIGDAGDETNTTYYVDLLHLTAAGNVIVAGIVKTAIESIT